MLALEVLIGLAIVRVLLPVCLLLVLGEWAHSHQRRQYLQR